MYYRPLPRLFTALLLLGPAVAPARAEVTVRVERHRGREANPEFTFKTIPALSDGDAGQDAILDVIDGKPEWGTEVARLNDGGGPSNGWEQYRNFMFGQGTAAGRIRMDLGSRRPVTAVNTYSYHEGDRAPQVYVLYGSDGQADHFNPAPRRGTDPAAVGWTRLAAVDTRPPGYPRTDNGTGQYGVHVADDSAPGAAIGEFRYLLWDIASNIDPGPVACWYSEFDVHVAGPSGQSRPGTVRGRDGKSYAGTIELSGDGFAIQPAEGAAVHLPLAQVAAARFALPVPADPEAEDQGGRLKGEYFEDTNLQRLKLVRYDPTVNYPRRDLDPDPAIPQLFSARWSGQIEAPYTELYHFYLRANDGVRLWVGGQKLMDDWDTRQSFEQAASFNLTAGQKADFKLEYRNRQGEGAVVLAWQSASGRVWRQVIGADRFSSPEQDPSEPARVTLASPTDGTWVVTPAPVEFEAKVATGKSPVAKVDFFSGPTPIGSVASPPYKLTWRDARPGHHRLTARATDADGKVTVSEPVSVNAAAGGTSPAPWGSLVVGSAVRDVASNYADGTFTLRSRDGTVHSNVDSVQFVCQPLDGDGEITARLAEIKSDNGGAFAGVMLRESLAPGARSVSLVVSKEGSEFLFRRDAANWVGQNNFARTAPCYLRLVRQGRRLRGYLSDDGQKWQPVGMEEIAALPHRTFVGLAATSQTADADCAATFDQVQLVKGLPAYESAGPGVETVNGSIVAGEVRGVTEADVLVGRPRGKDLAIPRAEVARILLRPLPAELAAGAPPGHAGVVLSTGDFFEGDFRGIKDNRVTVDSVLFGIRAFDASSEVLAIVLRDLSPDGGPAGARAKVRAKDGSVFVATSLRCDAGRLLLDDPSAGPFSLSFRDLLDVELNPGK